MGPPAAQAHGTWVLSTCLHSTLDSCGSNTWPAPGRLQKPAVSGLLLTQCHPYPPGAGPTGALASKPGYAGGRSFVSPRLGGRSAFTHSQSRWNHEVFQDVLRLPANSVASLDAGPLRSLGVPPPVYQLRHFASNGRLCRGTEPQPLCSAVMELVLGTHMQTVCDCTIGTAWPRSCGTGPESARHIGFQRCFCSSNQVPKYMIRQLLPDRRNHTVNQGKHAHSVPCKFSLRTAQGRIAAQKPAGPWRGET